VLRIPYHVQCFMMGDRTAMSDLAARSANMYGHYLA